MVFITSTIQRSRQQARLRTSYFCFGAGADYRENKENVCVGWPGNPGNMTSAAMIDDIDVT